MPAFPRTEAQILDLTRDVISGLKAEADNLPEVLVAAPEIESMLESFIQKRGAIAAREAELKELYREKNSVFGNMVKAVKSNLKYLERVTFRGNAARLALFGWGTRRPRTQTRTPNQPRVLEIVAEGEGWLELDWKPPKGGGRVVVYEVRRRVEDDPEWQLAGSVLKTECRLTNQPLRKALEFRIIALNKAGASMPSNSVRAVL